MNLQKAQSLILNILDSQNPKGIWESRKLALLTAFLPILAWPKPDAPRGSLDHLLNLEELVKRANLRIGDPGGSDLGSNLSIFNHYAWHANYSKRCTGFC